MATTHVNDLTTRKGHDRQALGRTNHVVASNRPVHPGQDMPTGSTTHVTLQQGRIRVYAGLVPADSPVTP